MPRRRVVHHPKVIYVHVEQDVHRALWRAVSAQRLTMSDVVRDLIHQYLRQDVLHPAVGPSAPNVGGSRDG